MGGAHIKQSLSMATPIADIPPTQVPLSTLSAGKMHICSPSTVQIELVQLHRFQLPLKLFEIHSIVSG